MAVYDLEEQEKLDELKAWWKQYGNWITNVLLALAIAAAAWQGWNWYQRNQAAQAASVFAVLQHDVNQNDAQKIKAATGELAEKFGSTLAAQQGALLAAKSSFDAGDLKTAKAQLTWIVENGKDELRDLARLNLAAVLLDEKSYSEALAQLAASHSPIFDVRFTEMKGDVLLAQDKKTEARTAYQAALTQLEKESTNREVKLMQEVLQQKLDSLEGA